MQKKRVASLLLVPAIAGVLFAGCKKPSTKTTTKPKDGKTTPHALNTAGQKKLLADADKAITIAISYQAGEDTATLDTAVAGPAAEMIVKTTKEEADAGKRKVRVYAKRKFKIKQFFKSAAGVSLSFIDEGYYVDAKTNQKLTAPTNTKHTLLLDLRQKNGRWIIYEIFSPQVKEQPPKQPSKK